MNWGDDTGADGDYICNRALKSVWGNPTPKTYGDIPQIAGVSIGRQDGLRIREYCKNGTPVRLNIKTQATRQWDRIPSVVARLSGTEEPDKFVMANGHFDAWEPGVSCNAGGNGTMLEVARVLAKHRDKIKRSIYFCFWNGHEIAESSGSTWFVDTHWDLLDRACVAGVCIDSTGMLGAVRYGARANLEVRSFVEAAITETLGEKTPAKEHKRRGDQSFSGVGIPSIVGRTAFDEAEVKRTNGAEIGWYNHTSADTLDKADPKNLVFDLKMNAAFLLGLANADILPYDFEDTLADIRGNLDLIRRESRDVIELDGVFSLLDELDGNAARLGKAKKALEGVPMSDERVRNLNRLQMRLTRALLPAFYTYCERVEQNSYDYTPGNRPIPFLYPAVDLAKLSPESLEYKLLYTEVLRGRNRILEALVTANEWCRAYLSLLGA